MRLLAILATLLALSCGHAAPLPHDARSDAVLREDFSSLPRLEKNWTVSASAARGATLEIERGSLRISLESGSETKLTRMLDPVRSRGRRVRVRGHGRTGSPDAKIRFRLSSTGLVLASADFAKSETSDSSLREIDLLLDVPTDIPDLEASLSFEGGGLAWLTELSIDAIDPAPTGALAITPRSLTNIESLARAAALVRYRHPADESAVLDWDRFLPGALQEVASAADTPQLLARLRDVFAPIAPSVVFSTEPSPPKHLAPDPGRPLVRWIRIGASTSWREGRDPDLARLSIDAPPQPATARPCSEARLVARGRSRGAATAVLQIGLPGEELKVVEVTLPDVHGEASEKFTMPAGAYNFRLGIRLLGAAEMDLQALSVTCDGQPLIHVDLPGTTWAATGATSLFEHSVDSCGTATCLVARRKRLRRLFDPALDLLSADLGGGVWAHIPLAVETDGTRTLPTARTPPHAIASSSDDVFTRIAVIASAWGTLSLFYPYFAALHVDWNRELRPALQTVGRSRTTRDCYDALFGLLTKLRDNHARAYHSTVSNDGILPIVLRRFDNHLVVTGSQNQDVPVGTEIRSIDRVPWQRAYETFERSIPAATVGWSRMIVPYWLTVARVDTLTELEIETPQHDVKSIALPHVSRQSYEASIKEVRVDSGTEVDRSVYYVDLDALDDAHWKPLLPKLATARAIIMDMRGYPTNTAFSILGHFTDTELRSPTMKTPLVGTDAYEISSWGIRPVAPRLKARLIVLMDGRSISAAETVLQIIKDHQLALLLGEPSSGTNGNVAVVALPGGFSMRFTRMRVELAGGQPLQGQGIRPDRIVQTSMRGVLSGRDEALEAAIAVARSP